MNVHVILGALLVADLLLSSLTLAALLGGVRPQNRR